MPLIEVGRWFVAVLLTGLTGWAAISDIRVRKIPNQVVLAILVLAIPWLMFGTLHWSLWALAAGAIALAVSFFLYSLGVVGAGDSKLFGAVALFVGLDHLWLLAVATALVGGLIAATSLAARPRRALVMFTMKGKGDFGRGIPYGVAIAAGALIVVWGVLLHLPLPGLIDSAALPS
jgi:prepilin peptidase CpaA